MALDPTASIRARASSARSGLWGGALAVLLVLAQVEQAFEYALLAAAHVAVSRVGGPPGPGRLPVHVTTVGRAGVRWSPWHAATVRGRLDDVRADGVTEPAAQLSAAGAEIAGDTALAVSAASSSALGEVLGPPWRSPPCGNSGRCRVGG